MLKKEILQSYKTIIHTLLSNNLLIQIMMMTGIGTSWFVLERKMKRTVENLIRYYLH